MSLQTDLIAEIRHEAATSTRILERVPLDKAGWKPHEKSMTLGRLATHTAECVQWICRILESDRYDFLEHPYNPHVAADAAELLDILNNAVTNATADLEKASDADLDKIWTVCRGEQVFFQLPKKVAIRSWGMSHVYHHRGQLSVYLRLLDVPVPGMYGPSADERS